MGCSEAVYFALGQFPEFGIEPGIPAVVDQGMAYDVFKRVSPS